MARFESDFFGYVSNDDRDMHLFWCPGCESCHYVALSGPVTWTISGSPDKPTVSPSILVGKGTPTQCHLFIRGGMLQFLSDCHHGLAGQIVPMTKMDDV